ncbi:MAG: hypothetical protein EBS01_08430 [Verrucomicrobia bacterium]|nr:hypothetical protein [Verrucomicrobiota bacterium]
MKYFLLIGGFLGFAAVLIASYSAGNRPAIALRDAAIGCMVGGLLFRMLHAAYLAGLKGCIADRARSSRTDELDGELEGSHRRV